MARLLRMPGIAANATEAVLQDWVVAEDVAFSAGDALATVETDKALVDVEADAAGTLLRSLVPPGSQVEVGAPIALLGEPGETVVDIDALLTDLGVVPGAPAVAPERRMVPDDPEGGTADTGSSDSGAAVLLPPPSPVAERDDRAGRIFISPLARRLAAEGGLSLHEIAGSGPHGRILRRDVERTLSGRVVAASTEVSAASVASVASPPGSVYDEVPHSRMRRAIAARLTQSKQETPHFYLRGSARVDRLLRLRQELNSSSPGAVRISVNDLVLKAVARAHVLVPDMNVVWTSEALRRFSTVDVAVAVATGSGLLTPVLKDVDAMSVSAVSARVQDLVEKARGGRLRQGDLEGGSVSVTNLGMYGTEEFAAIINPPQAAIIAVGAARREPVVKKGGTLGSGTIMRVTLSVDHRAVDGAVAAEWMRHFLALLERPVSLLR